jgi:hypothetical protein
MPPAFNLSQDQTLQFNLCLMSSRTWFRFTGTGRSLKILTGSVLRQILYFFVSTSMYKVIRHGFRHADALPSSAHTYRLLIFKELQSAYSASNRCVRQQQRGEIMRQFQASVNYFVSGFLKLLTTFATAFLLVPPPLPACFTALATPLARREANYIKRCGRLASVSLRMLPFLLFGPL